MLQGLRLPIVSIVLIGTLISRSNPKPLKHYPKVDGQSQVPTGCRSKIFPFASMGSFEMK
jgi:hypothetical protein